MPTLSTRVARLERAVFGKDRLPPRFDPNDLWQWCKRTGCTRGSYRQEPACMACKGYDPRSELSGGK